MGSDRARISFDPTRQYRSVVVQQGRVTLDADVNEQAALASEALRIETIDLVGPAGTPDNGYKVVTDGQDNLTVDAGTMYLGGWRLELDHPVKVASQLEWLDRPATTQETARHKSIVALHAIEQSISAVEDQALLEVALGGPDTAARTRLMQHIVEIPTGVDTCAEAALAVEKLLIAEGMRLDLKTLELLYNAGLKVGFYPPTKKSDPCCPPAQGGYLGADNQLIRVAVTSVSGGAGKLVWGWNNASFLYRATAVSANVLQLAQAPIDAAHTPQPGQTIEILRTTMVLGNAADSNYVAAPQGLIVTLGAGNIYDPATQQLTLPAGTTLPADPNTLFVRLWQAVVPFTAGKPAQLDAVSGLTVTIDIKSLPAAPLGLHPYWNFAVRPNTPQQVYPARYLEKPQPPDGPRQWLCGLAIFTPGAPSGPVTPDCRIPFLPLTDLGACDCCALTLNSKEDWQGKLNAAIAGKSPALSICFQPGKFNVTGKIVFKNKIVKITGAGPGTLIYGEKLEAVIEFDSCESVTMTDIAVCAGVSGYLSANSTVHLQGAVTLSDCAEIQVDRCMFACAGNDLRSASCLAVYNTPPADDPVGMVQETVVRILNSRFIVGNCQVGILLVNADRAVVQGNVVETLRELYGVTAENLASHPVMVSHLAKQLVGEMTIVDAAPRTTRRALRILKRKETKTANQASHSAGPAAISEAKNPAAGEPPTPKAAEAVTASEPTAPAAPAPSNPPAADSNPGVLATSTGETLVTTVTPPRMNLGELGRAHVTATFGTVQLKFISSAKLTNAWTDALARAGLTEKSTPGAVRLAVKSIAFNAVKQMSEAPQAFKNYLMNVLPQLYSTSSQGIVVGGNVATDIRILNNKVEGTAQGIHVGLSNMNLNPALTDLQVKQVQITGNTIAIRLTPATTGDRHGVYVGGVTSGLISENEISLTRTGDAGQSIAGITLTRTLGPRVIIERNVLEGFTTGIIAFGSILKNPLRLAAENYSTSRNDIVGFIQRENRP